METDRRFRMDGAYRGWLAVALVAVVAGCWLRGTHLERSATRSDEINQLRYAERGPAVAIELWQNPPWLNQIPFVDGIPALWCGWLGREVDIRTVREPFALAGMATLLLCAAWAWRRRGAAAGALCAVWLGLMPFAVYQSREAYYYAPAMLFAAWMALRAVDLAGDLSEGRAAPWWRYAEWYLAAQGTCLCHMSGWAVTATAGAWIAIAGWRGLSGKARTRHLVATTAVALGLLAGTIRWVLRALQEVHNANTGVGHHTGNPAGWVLSRAVPVMTGGSWFGVAALVAVVAAAVWIGWCRRSGRDAADPGLARLGWGAWGALAVSAASIAIIGNGVAKWTYFAVAVPIWIVWCSAVLAAAWERLGGRKRAMGLAATAAGLAAVLAWPAWEVTRVEGKPTPYHALRAWLDGNLAEGDVAIVDRWLEPWNEMALYAPEKVNVGFTVPDEPYEQYVANDWRGVTKRFFEQNGAQAFIRLSRNHADRMGVWTWPEKWFAHRSVVTNAAGLRLAKTGFAPMEEFYLNPSRVEVEIFWDTHEEAAAKQFTRGAPAAVFFGGGWKLFKPWQQGDFRDYRILGDEKGVVEVWRPAGAEKKKCRVLVTGTAVGGEATVRAGRGGLMRFRPGEISTQVFEETFGAGQNMLEFAGVQGPGRLAALEVRVE